MLLGDSKIKELVDNGNITNADRSAIGPISLDLTTDAFFEQSDSGTITAKSCTLKPGESVFVGSVEIIDLPADIAARVLLRNSRIREGLSLDAPLYFPGHKTRVYFRVTNISAQEVTLNTAKGLAALAFEEVKGVEHPYEGAFSDELDFRGMGQYREIYASELSEVERAADDVRGIEKRLYGNVMTMMAVFVGIFSLVDVNLMTAISDTARQYFVAINLATVGSLSALFGLMSLMLKPSSQAQRYVPWVVAVIAFAAAFAFALCS